MFITADRPNSDFNYYIWQGCIRLQRLSGLEANNTPRANDTELRGLCPDWNVYNREWSDELFLSDLV